MKAVVAAFNQEKALVGAFSVITNLRMELFQALIDTRMSQRSLTQVRCPGAGRGRSQERWCQEARSLGQEDGGAPDAGPRNESHECWQQSRISDISTPRREV